MLTGGTLVRIFEGKAALAALLTRYREVIRLAQRPRFLVSAGLSLLAALGRPRGDPRLAPPRIPSEQSPWGRIGTRARP